MPQGRKKGSWSCDDCGRINSPDRNECWNQANHPPDDEPAETEAEQQNEEDD